MNKMWVFGLEKSTFYDKLRQYWLVRKSFAFWS